ncbi:hypothetical protein [Staphylococcus xylosus]|uniref:hypothetical protein n=1 Tax=Staphylococcus xylosus TaxID=1288 RepID=UPI001CDD118C|nr:hypothetical protein [Staphylococcus xylosus]MCQ3817010.1 hypothetical protein [Staphylococcus xylosus]MCQ3819681.1 hypothetical protein [Staphylococcus xylosus]UBV37273.1 hypothetical protein JGY88_12740 [Staphylococcus xylosus]
MYSWNEKDKHEKIENIANALMLTASLLILACLILYFIFYWQFLDYIVNGAGALYLLGLLIGTISNIMERDIKGISFNVLMIIVLAYIFYR